MISSKVLKLLIGFPLTESTWILDFTESNGNTGGQKQNPPNPPQSMRGRKPTKKKILCGGRSQKQVHIINRKMENKLTYTALVRA